MSKTAVEKAKPPGAREPGTELTKASQMFPFLPLKLVHQCSGMVPLRLPRRQCGQGKQSCAVVGILTVSPQERADPKLEKHSGRSSVLAGGVWGIALTSREEPAR